MAFKPYVLVVDDSEDRHQTFEREFGDVCAVLHAFDYDEAVHLLSVSAFTIYMVCFDHDLGLGKSGSDLASFILNELPEDRFPVRAIVHSNNYQGAENIASKLRTAGITTSVRPFSFQMVKQLKKELEPE